jgi:hypothetical protein
VRPVQALPLLKVLWGTFAYPSIFGVPWFRAINLPLLALIGIMLLWNLTDESTGVAQAGILYAGYLAATSWLAVRTHRLVLLGPAGSEPRNPLRETRLVGIYLASLAGLWLIWLGLTSLLSITAGTGILFLTHSPYSTAGESPPVFNPQVQRAIDYAGKLAALPASYVVARLTPMLPAISLERAWNPRAAWEMSRGNGWRIALVVLGLPYAFTVALETLSHSNAGGLEIAALAIVFAIVASLEIIGMSLVYRELERPEPPPTPPPV